MDRLTTTAIMAFQRITRIPKSHLLLIVLSLGAFSSLIATNHESRNRRTVHAIHTGASDIGYMEGGIAGNTVPGAKMMMAQSMESMAPPALMASSLSSYGGASSRAGIQHDASTSYYSSPEHPVDLGTMVLDSMKNLSRNEEEDYQNQTQTRFLIHEGNVELKVYVEDMEPMADKIIALAKEKARGYVESNNFLQETRWEYNPSTRTHENMECWFIHLQLRISNSVFHPIITEITNLAKRYDGGIINMYTNTRDATDEYIDVTARADTLEKSRQALEVLLTKSTSVQDVLQVQRELTSLTQQVESYRKRAIHIHKASDMSRLSVHIREQKRSVSFTDTNTWDPYKTLLTAFYHMKIVAQFAGDVLIYSLMWAMPLSLLMLTSLFFSRSQSSRRD